jgi:hypothetical protein
MPRTKKKMSRWCCIENNITQGIFFEQNLFHTQCRHTAKELSGPKQMACGQRRIYNFTMWGPAGALISSVQRPLRRASGRGQTLFPVNLGA